MGWCVILPRKPQGSGTARDARSRRIATDATNNNQDRQAVTDQRFAIVFEGHAD